MGLGSQELHLQERPQQGGAEQRRDLTHLLSPTTMLGASSPAFPTPVASGENIPNVSKAIGSYFLMASNMCCYVAILS